MVQKHRRVYCLSNSESRKQRSTGQSLASSKPSFQMKGPWRGRLLLCFVKQMMGLPPMLHPADIVLCSFCSVWASFRSKRMFVVSELDALKELWKPNSPKNMLLHINVSGTPLALTDNPRLHKYVLKYLPILSLAMALAS